MRNYLDTFLREYNYPESSCDVLLAAYDKIAESSNAKGVWDEAIGMYNESHNCNYMELLGKIDKISEAADIHEYTVGLLLFICLSKRLRELYIEKGISLDFYKKSMEDLRYKLDECLLVYGMVGSFVAPWFCGFFNLTRFGMGRMQFEVVPFGATYEKDGIKLLPDTKVISMHIPRSGEPLSESACREAYACAKEFFKDQINSEKCPFVCYSWLLDPHLEEFLPKHTNTYRFFKSFDIYMQVSDKERTSLWRLFDTMEQNPDKLPADTSMRRAFIDYLKKGGKLSIGCGVMFV